MKWRTSPATWIPSAVSHRRRRRRHPQGCSVTGRIQLTAENVYAVGGLAGYLDYSTVTDCSADVELVLKAAEEIGYAGGLAGYVDYDSAFAGCTASGSIRRRRRICALGGLAGF